MRDEAKMPDLKAELADKCNMAFILPNIHSFQSIKLNEKKKRGREREEKSLAERIELCSTDTLLDGPLPFSPAAVIW